MIRLGEWLEEFLFPGIGIWDFKRLFEEALLILGIKAPNSLSGTWLKDMEQTMSIEGLRRIEKAGFLDGLARTHPFEGEALRMMHSRRWADLFLREIKRSGAPWEILIENIMKRIDQDIDILSASAKKRDKEWWEKTEAEVSVTIREFIQAYGSLTDRYVLKDGRLIKTRTFYNHAPESLQSHSLRHDDFYCAAAISNIFFDFLSLGGQNYYIYCENCDRFTAVKRKGRKKYCSDICRTASQRK